MISRILKFSILSSVCISLLLIIACSSDDGPNVTPPDDPQAEALEKLTSGSWSLQSVTRNGSNVTSEYDGFTVSFTSTRYSTTNGTGAWEASGNWSWEDPMGTRIELDNGVILEISFSNNDTELTVTFTLTETTFGIGRTKGLAGNYVFVLTK